MCQFTMHQGVSHVPVYNAPRSLTCALSFLSSQIFYTNLVGNKILVVIVFQPVTNGT